MICALLIGRKGSQGFPGKNVHPVLGRPLAAYPLLAARKTRSIDAVFVSTDDPSLKKLGRLAGAHVISRPASLATKIALGEDVFAHGYSVIRNYAAQQRKPLELLVLLMANAPAIQPKTIQQGIDVLRRRPEIDSCVTVSRYNMWSPLRARKIGRNGLLHPFVPFKTFGNPATLSCDRDSQGDVWFADMGVSIVRPRCLEHLSRGLLPQRWMGQRIYPLKQWGGLDVDYEWQLPLVEFWLKAHGNRRKEKPT